MKTRPKHTWTKRPRELYCSLTFASLFQLFSIGGSASANEIPLFEMSEHYSAPHKNTAWEQCLVGSFTGEVGSYNATEPYKGRLTPDGNRSDSAIAKAGLTARRTCRAGTKVGYSDPVMPSGRHTA